MSLSLSVLLRRREPRTASEPPVTQGSCLRGSTIAGRGDDGFSLIEAMVALAVLAIAAVGLMRTVESHIDSTRALERRAAAMWVAENRLAELELGAPGGDSADMLGQRWRVAVEKARTDDPEIVRVRITVFAPADSAPLASLDGFVDGGAQ